MAKDFDVDAKGLADLRRDFRRIDPEALKEVQKALKGAAGLAAAEAAELAPRKTGALGRSYKPFTRGNVAGVRSNLPYAGVIEYGGTISPKGTPISIRANEPIHRAIERQRNAIVEHLGDGIEAAARHTGWH